MEFLPDELQEYCESHSKKEDPVLHELNRQTHLNVLKPRMLSGHHQGVFLEMISKMIRPKQILEIGTYTGYASICLAKGLQETGKLHTIDINEELETMTQKYFKKAGIQNQIEQHIGNALEIIPTIDTTFDLVFIDADKINYSNYFDLVLPKLNTGGIILTDNVLWSGKVLQAKSDKDTEAIKAYNQKLASDDRVETVIVPIRDGISITRKKIKI